jgi:hypothetical protein
MNFFLSQKVFSFFFFSLGGIFLPFCEKYFEKRIFVLQIPFVQKPFANKTETKFLKNRTTSYNITKLGPEKKNLIKTLQIPSSQLFFFLLSHLPPHFFSPFILVIVAKCHVAIGSISGGDNLSDPNYVLTNENMPRLN